MTELDRCKAFFEENGYIEFFDPRESGTWKRMENPSWDEDVEYRVPPSDWQPIETAPKDGSSVLLAWNGFTVFGSYLDNSKSKYPWEGWRPPSGQVIPKGKPTHWMPLPEPPEK